MYFILVYCVNPIYKMSNGADNYRTIGKKYGVAFDGDDQLANINAAMTEIIEENIELKSRLKGLRSEFKKDVIQEDENV